MPRNIDLDYGADVRYRDRIRGTVGEFERTVALILARGYSIGFPWSRVLEEEIA